MRKWRNKPLWKIFLCLKKVDCGSRVHCAEKNSGDSQRATSSGEKSGAESQCRRGFQNVHENEREDGGKPFGLDLQKDHGATDLRTRASRALAKRLGCAGKANRR